LLALALVLVSCAPSASEIQFAVSEAQTPYPTITGELNPKIGEVTRAELMNYIQKDRTNLNTLTPSYNCVNFSMDLANNAKAAGMIAWVVGVTFADGQVRHTFVAFMTSDRGIVWIEPQTDEAYIVSDVGQPLCFADHPGKCWDKGTITDIIQPALCDPVTQKCRQE
jgi:hypothetical protein